MGVLWYIGTIQKTPLKGAVYMKDRNTSWVKYAVFLTFLALLLGALVFWLCAYLDSQSGKAPSDPTPPVEDGSEFPDGSAIVPDGPEKILPKL